jgi:hypothetical protein
MHSVLCGVVDSVALGLLHPAVDAAADTSPSDQKPVRVILIHTTAVRRVRVIRLRCRVCARCGIRVVTPRSRYCLASALGLSKPIRVIRSR